ncbi:hypothetical protein [Streptosporangium sp. KLBMP 9127]|nr:hypothetical protein [Streptosporangium sp. KLBMP 9127]
MNEHPISVDWDEIPEDADDRALLDGAHRTYRCACGIPLGERVKAELHAMETDQCSTCFGRASREVLPGFTEACRACAGTGRRGAQLMWETAYGEAEQVITVGLVRQVTRRLPEPFALSQAADAVRGMLGLPAGRLPVGPRVRDLLLRLEQEGELVMVSAPDELLGNDGSMVLYRDPLWRRITTT